MSEGNQTGRLVIQLGDGGTPTENFAFTCGTNSQEIGLTNKAGETEILDCDNPLDAPAIVLRYLESQDTSINLAGTVTREAWPTWRQWADLGLIKNVKVILDEPAGSGGGFWVVPAMLTEMKLTKQGSAIVNFTATIMGAGKRVWTDAA